MWLKVTRSGEPVVDLDKIHKQTFEYLFVCSRQDITAAAAGAFVPRIICSVPSAVQSHKPPLSDVLDKVFGVKAEKESRNLEVFGRYLLPHWTTVGNQCLKFQDLKYFETPKLGKK